MSIDLKCLYNLLNVISYLKINASNFWLSSWISDFKIVCRIWNHYRDCTVNTCALAMSSVTLLDTSLCLFVQFLLKHTFASGYCPRHQEDTLWMLSCSVKLLSSFHVSVFGHFHTHTHPPPLVNFIWILPITKWKNYRGRVTWKGRALGAKHHHYTKSTV